MASPSQFLKLRGGDEQSSRVQDAVNATLQPIAAALNATPIMGAAPPAWIRPTLLGDFVNATAAIGGTWAIAAFHKDCLGYVHWKGKIITPGGFGAAGVMITAPIGYRPLETLTFSVEGSGAFQSVRVLPDGSVVNVLAIGVGGSVDLDLHYLAEQ